MPMESIVREVITRAGEEPRVPEAPTSGMGGFAADDAELERILASLRTNIKIVGVGGGGTNTIDRLVEAGIVGAELFAANTDAQHLLTIRAPHKILLGRRTTRGLGAGAPPPAGGGGAPRHVAPKRPRPGLPPPHGAGRSCSSRPRPRRRS